MTAITIGSGNSIAIRQANIEVIKTLPAKYQKFVMAKQSVKLSDLPKHEAVEIINQQYKQVIFNLQWGKSIDEAEIKADDRIITCGNCYDLICDKYNSLTVDELKLTFLRGSMEDYGKFYGLGLKTLSDWIRAYSNDENKKKAMAEYNRLLELVKFKSELTPEQEEENILQLCLEFWNEYRDKSMIRQFIMRADKTCSIYYDVLKKKGLINFPLERKEQLFERAKKEYYDDLERKVKDRTVNFRKTDMEQILEVALKDNKSFKSLCGRIGLTEFFNDLISQQKDLGFLLSNLKQ